MKKWFAPLALVALYTACGGDNDPSSRLTSFRSIAIRATRVIQSDTCDAGLVAAPDSPTGTAKLGKTNCDTPGSYAHPGDELQFEQLWHDPDPAATHSWGWAFCVNPPSSSILGCFQKIGADLAKLPPEQRTVAALGLLKQRIDVVNTDDPSKSRLNAKNFETNDLVAPNPDGTKPDTRTIFRLTVPPTALDELASAPPQAKANAVLGVVFFACPGTLRLNFEALQASRVALPIQCIGANNEELGTDKFTIGIKRVFIRAKDENPDPRIASVLWDGQPWPETETKTVTAGCDADENNFGECKGEKHTITPVMQQPFADVGTDELGQSFSEQVVIQYYTTEGLFEFDVKRAADPDTKFAGRGGKTGVGLQSVWILARDNRGGVSWVKRLVDVK